MRDLYLYNTATRSKVLFSPLNPPLVRMYTCGPTVYGDAHIGNLRAYIGQDVLIKTLEYIGYKSLRVMNVTDVGHLTSDSDTGEDKMEIGAKREGSTAWDLAKKYERIFLEDVDALNICRPDHLIRATDTIAEQIQFIRRLEEAGFTYVISDGVYFDSSKFPRYADFAHLDIAGLQAGARVEMQKGKKNLTDFALWKFSETPGKRDMEWESPWGVGFPGWHIECSAIALKELGEQLDIHAGGVDHIPVHHTNEIAQTESLTGKPFSRFWFHNEFLQVDGGKMSKSLGTVYSLATIKEWGIEPLAFRLFTYSATYRSKLNVTKEGLQSAQTSLERLRGAVSRLPEQSGIVPQLYQDQMDSALTDDLNIPEALAVLWQVLRSDLAGEEKRAFIERYEPIFSLDLFKSEKGVTQVPEYIQELVQKRQAARVNGEWQEADRLREQIESEGYSLTDTTLDKMPSIALQKP